MKKFLAILASTLMAVSLIGCGSDTSAGEPAAEPAAEPATQEAAPAAETSGDSDLSTKKVGVCIYQFSDNFMTLFRTELEKYLIEKGFAKENITIVDGANDQATQSGQIDSFIADGVDVLIINLVNPLPQQLLPIRSLQQTSRWFTSTVSPLQMSSRDGQTTTGTSATLDATLVSPAHTRARSSVTLALTLLTSTRTARSTTS